MANILKVSSNKQNNWTNFMIENGYTPISTFFGDLSIADVYGIDAIKNTYKRVFNEWKNDTEMFTEFVMCLNHKIWEWWEKDKKIAEIYDELWRKAEDYVYNNWNDEQKNYYFRITD